MKRILAALLCVLVCLSTGCTPHSGPAVPDAAEPKIEAAARTAAAAVAQSQEGAGELLELSGDVLTGYLNSLGLTVWEDAAVLTGQGMDGREITVVRMEDHAAARQAGQFLEQHRTARISDFFGYAPAQAQLLEQAQVLVQDDYAAFLACTDGEGARKALAACLGGDAETVHIQPESIPEPEPIVEPVFNPDLDISGFPTFDPPNDVDMTLYDNAAVVRAWDTGDETGLSDKDRVILERCRAVFAEVIREDMTDFEKELALHEWILAHGKYDVWAQDNVAHIGQPDNNNPYGLLVGGYGICLGFATAFQLFMDLAKVECITVVGAAYDSTGDHAWNMVKLDGEWYCVDVTWDVCGMDFFDPARASHDYFNVTSDMLRMTQHQWDYRNTPEATATRYRWDGVSQLPD